MTPKQGIFSKMTYAYANSKRFIKIQPYTISAQAGERRRLPSPSAIIFQNFLTMLKFYGFYSANHSSNTKQSSLNKTLLLLFSFFYDNTR